MKRLLLALAGLCLVASSLFAQKKSSKTFDFRNVRWNMSMAQVRSSESDRPTEVDSDALVYSDEMGGLPAHVIYNFSHGKLFEALVEFYTVHSNIMDYVAEYGKIERILKAKYGDPSWTHDTPADADVSEKVHYWSTWDHATKSTTIDFGLDVKPGKHFFGVRYRSADYQAPKKNDDAGF